MFKLSKSFNLFVIIYLSISVSHAGALFGFGGAFTQDKNTLADQSTVSNYAVNLSAYAPLSRGDRVLYLGVEAMMTSIQQSLDAITKATLNSNDYMLSLKYAFAQKEVLAFTFGFSPYTQASYSVTALNKDLWFGTSYMAKFSLQPDIEISTAKIKVAASILYYYSAYTKKTNNNSSSPSSGDKQSFERSFTAPAIDIIFKF